MATTKYPVQGTERKLNIHIAPVGQGISMDEFNFVVDFYGMSGMLHINKQDCIRVDANNYIALVDTSLTGNGLLDAKITAFIPDADFDSGFRREVLIISGIEMIY